MGLGWASLRVLLCASCVLGATCTYQLKLFLGYVSDTGEKLRAWYYDENMNLIAKMKSENNPTAYSWHVLKKIDSAITCTGCVMDGKMRITYEASSTEYLEIFPTSTYGEQYNLHCTYSNINEEEKDAYWTGGWHPNTGAACSMDAYDWDIKGGDKCQQVLLEEDDYCDYELEVYLSYVSSGSGILSAYLSEQGDRLSRMWSSETLETGTNTLVGFRMGCTSCILAGDIGFIPYGTDISIDTSEDYTLRCSKGGGSPTSTTKTLSTSWSAISGYSCSASGTIANIDDGDGCVQSI